MENIFNQVIANITGGLITDVKTAIIGMISLQLIIVATDHIFKAFAVRYAEDKAEARMPGIGELNQLKKDSIRYAGTAEGDVYRMQYRRKLKKYVDGSEEPEWTYPDRVCELGAPSNHYVGWSPNRTEDDDDGY